MIVFAFDSSYVSLVSSSRGPCEIIPNNALALPLHAAATTNNDTTTTTDDEDAAAAIRKNAKQTNAG
jgi:hypothetical protein